MRILSNSELNYVAGGGKIATAGEGCFIGGSAAYSTYPSTASTAAGCVAGAGVALLGGSTTAMAAAGTAAGLAVLNKEKAQSGGEGGDDGGNWEMIGASQMTAQYGDGLSSSSMLLIVQRDWN